jgi:hypothetical protein
MDLIAPTIALVVFFNYRLNALVWLEIEIEKNLSRNSMFAE